MGKGTCASLIAIAGRREAAWSFGARTGERGAQGGLDRLRSVGQVRVSISTRRWAGVR
jgi:hypothetical protein